MVNDDPQLACVVLHELPRLVDGRDLAVLAGDADVAHRGSRVTSNEDGTVRNVTLGPALQREAGILWQGGIATNEAGQRAGTGRAECLRRNSQRRLEEDCTHLIVIGGINPRRGSDYALRRAKAGRGLQTVISENIHLHKSSGLCAHDAS